MSDLPSVLFVTRTYPPVRGGMEQLSYDLTTEITTHTKTKIIANRNGKAFFPIFVPIACARMLRNRNNFDICHFSDATLSSLAWTLRRSSPKRPIAMSVHGLDITYASQGGIIPALYKQYLSRFFLSADAYICNSRHVERIVKERFPTAQTVVIPPGIRDIWYAENRTKADLARITGRPDIRTRPVILTVGRLVKRKGVMWFVQNVLPRLDSDIMYLVMGDGPERNAIITAAKKQGVSDRLIMTGSRSKEDIQTAYNTADVFVMPNIQEPNDVEGFGLVAIEAASCGLPVVASSVQGIVDAVHDRQNGILVKPEQPEAFVQAINSLLSDHVNRNSFGANARAFTIDRFSWSNITKQYLDTFRHIQTL